MPVHGVRDCGSQRPRETRLNVIFGCSIVTPRRLPSRGSCSTGHSFLFSPPSTASSKLDMYLDNQRAREITETISREKKIQREFFEKETAAGRLPAWTPPAPAAPHQQPVGLPPFTATYRQQPELCVSTAMSQNMWAGTNSGYVLRNGPHMASAAHQDFVFDEQAVAFMKAQGAFDKRHHKRRDEFVMYVEAAARAHHQLGGRPAATGQPAKK